ncbi:ABC transporter ATP-binding protein [Sphaerobacter thermophilus]|jgi:ABC-type multidrug transport system ATPase subunit|uniref:ABC transporter related protein n=1 Tax=Sphaerobacter thermophilus (strain ATCC 49802 / DSM 20745 / KCCM 41009 / NCIMB 13125 / S 6022) TaxID=479434 RepID=D1C5V5_SPHTD|nr:ABC transporter ATP-binding protein [Sphaerobacter thermophilus]ACZ39507.1 ABC transporter related protein [Sphaerobacter thermophilus DSM 20745]
MEIVIEELSKHYGSVRALDGVSLRVPGGMFGLLGPNGAGKTTLMRILVTLLAPTSGRVTIGGIDVMRDPAKVRERLGYIPQEFGFYRSLNAYEMLDYIGTMKRIPPRERKRQIEAVLEEVNLTADAKRRVGTYSGGMKQRLGIAQALLGDPDLLVVDEPTAGLDPEERIRFRNLLVRISGRRTVLLSTHIVADVEASCTGLAVLRQGRLAFAGTPEELVERARGRVWQVEVEPGEWDEVAARVQVVSSRTVGGRVQLRVVADENPLGRGVPVEPGLEDGYLAVSGSVQREEWLVHV